MENRETSFPLMQTVVFDKTSTSWAAIAPRVLDIAQEAVSWNELDPVYGKTDDAIAYPTLEAAFMDEHTAVIIETNAGTGEVLGYSLAMPIGKFDPQRIAETDTAYVYMTMIAKEHRGKKKVVPINEAMMRTLSEKGYRFAERDAMCGKDEEGNQKTDGYPQAIERGFAGSIVEAYDHTPYEEYGLQRHFRIDIQQYLEKINNH